MGGNGVAKGAYRAFMRPQMEEAFGEKGLCFCVGERKEGGGEKSPPLGRSKTWRKKAKLVSQA